ncbi:DUF92 domain-containing protein [Silvibacterium acidisoli]|uniref:DUF92 domain-containing protein n=1 Tax=Acidobacteriaceae bacterium ZG23-2 TaxID=2883246 RepID=UPI00406CB848
MTHLERNFAGLRWQSQGIVLLILPLAAVFASLETLVRWPIESLQTALALGLGLFFALLVWSLRAATAGAAATGGLFTACLYFWTPGLHTLLWPLLTLFLLTFAATRFGRGRKEQMGLAEEKHGRNAAQVVANLGIAVAAGIPLSTTKVLLGLPAGRFALMASIAAMAEATADTLSSELGQVLGGTPRMLTTMRQVPAGTDGAISLKGTLAGCAGALVIALLGGSIFQLTPVEIALCCGGGIFGLFFDSLIGATLERAQLLNNDAVNFLSTLASALVTAGGATLLTR